MFQSIFPENSDPSKEGFILLCVCLSVHSRGFVRLTPDGEGPQIDPNFLEDPRDVDCLRKGEWGNVTDLAEGLFNGMSSFANVSLKSFIEAQRKASHNKLNMIVSNVI